MAASQYLRALEARGLLTCRRVGLRVEYRPTAAATGGAGGEILTALRFAFRGRAQPTEALFKLATAFTHPRRVEVFRAMKNERGFLCENPSGHPDLGASALPSSRQTGEKRLRKERRREICGDEPEASIRACVSAPCLPIALVVPYFANYDAKSSRMNEARPAR